MVNEDSDVGEMNEGFGFNSRIGIGIGGGRREIFYFLRIIG